MPEPDGCHAPDSGCRMPEAGVTCRFFQNCILRTSLDRGAQIGRCKLYRCVKIDRDNPAFLACAANVQRRAGSACNASIAFPRCQSATA